MARELTNLSRLEITTCKTLTDVSPIWQQQKLIFLILSKLNEMKDLAGFRLLENLEHFVIGNTQILSGDLTPILDFPKIKYVAIYPQKKNYNYTMTTLYEALNLEKPDFL